MASYFMGGGGSMLTFPVSNRIFSAIQKKVKEIPTDKPVVVHCAGGYRSAIGSSILEKEFLQAQVYDLSEAVKEFQGTKV